MHLLQRKFDVRIMLIVSTYEINMHHQHDMTIFTFCLGLKRLGYLHANG